MEAKDVGYTKKGREGRTCTECVNFRPEESDPSRGTCFGHDVVAAGSCNRFSKK